MSRKIPYYLVVPGAAAASCAGCSRAPNVVILGAFFPGWMVCALLGIAVTLLIRVAVALARPALGVPPLLYPLLALLCAALGWIIIFRGGA